MTSPSFDRRTFVTTSAATAAFLATRAGAQTAGTSTTGAKTLDPIRVGLVGCGGRGTGAASNALTADPGVRLVALGDVLPGRIDAAHDELKKDPAIAARIEVPKEKRFTGFDALQHVLASGVDVVLLATPPVFRPAQIEACLAAGKHVFAEKPVAVDAPGVRSVLASVRVAREKKLSLVSGFCWRTSTPERESYKRIHDGQIGELRAVYATYNGSPNAFVERASGMSDMEWQIRNWYHFLWLGGDHLVEQAVHSVDKINWAFDNELPLRCWAVGGRAQRTSSHPGNIYDHFGVTWEYARDRRAFLQARQWENCENDNSDWVYGEKGVARINGWGPEHWIRGENNWEHDGERNDMYLDEHVELFRGIRDGNVRNDGEWMTNSTLLAIMGRMAAYTGGAITWDQALASQESLLPKSLELGDVAVSAVPRPGYTRFV